MSAGDYPKSAGNLKAAETWMPTAENVGSMLLRFGQRRLSRSTELDSIPYPSDVPESKVGARGRGGASLSTRKRLAACRARVPQARSNLERIDDHHGSLPDTSSPVISRIVWVQRGGKVVDVTRGGRLGKILPRPSGQPYIVRTDDNLTTTNGTQDSCPMTVDSQGAHWVISCVDDAMQTFFTSLNERWAILGDGTKPVDQVDHELESLEKYRDLLCQTISSHEIRVKRKKNALAPLHQLPIELFIDILQQCITDDDPRFQSSVSLRRLTQVSTTWFHTIKATPGFWQYLSSEDTAYTRTLVTRMNTAGPLKILCQADDRSAQSTLDTAIAHASRWQYLFLAGDRQPVLRACSRLNIPTQSLTELYIYIDSSEEGDEAEADEDGSPTIVLGEGRNLLAVELERLGMPWNCPRLTGLRVISLRSIKNNVPSISQLYTILASSPLITCIALTHLRRDGEEDTPPTLNAHQPIQFDQLSKLQLIDIPPDMTDLVLSVVQSSCAIRLDVGPIIISPHSGVLPSFLRQSLTTSTFQEITLHYRTHRDNIEIYTEQPETGGPEWIHNLQGERPGYCITFQADGRPGWRTLARWLSGLTLPPVKLLIWFEVGCSPVARFPVELLDSLPSLASINVGDYRASGNVFRYLAENDVCPCLTGIDIDRWQMATREHLDDLIALIRRRRVGGPGKPVAVTNVLVHGDVLEGLQREIDGDSHSEQAT